MTKGEHARLVAWRWRLLCRAADDGNVARTCRHFGVSRKSFYKWKRRLDEHGQAGLGDRARVPHGSPRATPRSGCDMRSLGYRLAVLKKRRLRNNSTRF
jgi:transposase-like protein